MSDRHYPSAAIPAKIGDPTVVGAGVSLRQLDVVKFGLPKYAKRRVEHDRIEPLGINELHALCGDHGTERGSRHVSLFRRRAESLNFVLAHASNSRQAAALCHL